MIAAGRLGRPSTLVPLLLAFVVATAYAWNCSRALDRNDTSFFVDLRPMYCAGVAMSEHADPYATEPAKTCQDGFGALNLPALPAPLPPYALELFAIAAPLSFEALGRTYVALAIVTFGASAYWLGKLAGVRWWIAGLALFWIAFYTSANLGQTSIFAIAAITGSAFLVERRQPLLAGLLATGTAFSPTLALPVLALLAITQPRARLGIAAGLALLFGLTMLAGMPLSSEYVRFELPVHARSEAYMPLQFSATWLAAALGIEPEDAVRVGGATYALTLVLGVCAGIAFVRRGRAALGILYAASAVTVGGSFIHITQIAAALPLGLVLASDAKRHRTVIALATGMLGVQWLATWYETVSRTVAITTFKAATQSLVLASLLRATGNARARSILTGSAFVVACALASFACARLPLADARHASPLAAEPHALLSDGWKTFNDQTNRGRDVTRITATKAIPWFAVVVIVLFGAAALRDDSLLERRSVV